MTNTWEVLQELIKTGHYVLGIVIHVFWSRFSYTRHNSIAFTYTRNMAWFKNLPWGPKFSRPVLFVGSPVVIDTHLDLEVQGSSLSSWECNITTKLKGFCRKKEKEIENYCWGKGRSVFVFWSTFTNLGGFVLFSCSYVFVASQDHFITFFSKMSGVFAEAPCASEFEFLSSSRIAYIFILI